MSNPFTQVREAVWSLLDGDTSLAGYIDGREGTRYKFGESEDLPLRLGSGDCPALVVEPVKGEIDWESTQGHALVYRLGVKGYLDEIALEGLEEFAHMAYVAVAAGLPDLCVLDVEGVEFAGPSFGTYRSGGARFGEFVLGVVVTVHVPLPQGAA